MLGIQTGDHMHVMSESTSLSHIFLYFLEMRQSLFNFCFQTTLWNIHPGFIFLATEHLLVICGGFGEQGGECDERGTAVIWGTQRACL